MENTTEENEKARKMSELAYLDLLPSYQLESNREEITRAARKYSI